MLLNHRLVHGLAHCPSCETALVAPFAATGKNARCQCCQTRFTLPAVQELYDAAVAYLVDHEDDGSAYDPFDVDYRPAPVSFARMTA